MKLCGFTFIRNALKFSYPVVESIQSILPICDEFVVNVGKSDDDTLALIESIDSDKIRIMQSVWDDSLREHGQVLAIETNKTFDAVSSDCDWIFYLQADEVVHEKYLDVITDSTHKWRDHQEVEGLLFNYFHFYGTYDYVGDSRRWYRREIRIIRNDKSIRSFKDAQGFRKNGNKLKVKLIDAYIYHYGWIKHPRIMQEKMRKFHSYWHDDTWIDNELGDGDLFNFSGIDSLKKFEGTHPKIMQSRIAEADWSLNLDPTKKKLSLKNKILLEIEKITGIRLGEYKNYKLI